jgi:hypothetical protein
MSGNDKDEDASGDAFVPKAKTAARTDLVPLCSPVERSAGFSPRWSPNPVFVTHLIATAEHAPQTRSLHRASFADARSAYRASETPVRALGTRTRQII